MYTITCKNKILNKRKKTYGCLLQVCSRYGKYQALLYSYRSPLFIKPGKIQQSLRFKFTEVKSYLRLWKCKKSPQTCGFAVADHPLLFYGICGCGIKFKFAVSSTAEKPFDCSARGQRSIVLDEQFL